MRVLSLFDGISCAKVAMERRLIPVEAYYAAEVDKHAIKVSQANHPYIHHVGDVRNVTPDLLRIQPIDLLIGGSPCQDLSIANAHRKGLKGERSGLFYEYVRVKEEFKPKWWVLENVASMSKEARAEITANLGVEPILINAALVSPQIRKRLFWTNIPVSFMPYDRGLTVKDVAGHTDDEYFYHIEPSMLRALENGKVKLIGPDDKARTVTCRQRRWSNTGFLMDNGRMRYFTPEECELLQGLPAGYTRGIPMTQRYKTVGNAFHVEVVGHILSFMTAEVPCF